MSLLYQAFRPSSRWILGGLARVRVEGREHVPRSGPFLLLPNHQSIADPFLVQSHCPRPVHSMTKSTQFASPFSRWLLPRLLAFPVRRYRIDPQAVRVLLRLLDAGNAACLYPEGERSWDGELQPFRRGALRVVLRAGVPAVPVGIHGMGRLWPRWLRGPRPTFGPRIEVRLRFGEALELGEIRDREKRERLLPELDRTLRERLRVLSRPPGEDSARPATRPGSADASGADPQAPRASAPGHGQDPVGSTDT